MKLHLFKLSLLLILTAFSFKAQSQASAADSLKIDSLKRVLQTQKEDTNKVNTLDTLALLFYIKSDDYNSLQYAKLTLALSQKLFFKKGQGFAFMIFSYNQFNAKNYQQQLKDAYTALSFFTDANFKEGIFQSYRILFGAYYFLHNIPEQNKIIYEIIKSSEKFGDMKTMAWAQTWLGFNYYNEENYEQALKAYSDALRTFRQIGSDTGTGQCYIYMAKIYMLQNKYKEAQQYDSIGLKIAKRDGDNQMTGIAYLCLGDIVMHQVDSDKLNNKNTGRSSVFNKALENYIASLEYAKSVPDSGSMGDSYERICDIHIKLHQFENAQKYADSAFLMAKTTNSYDNYEMSYLVQTRLDSTRGNYSQAFESYKEYIRYRDSIVNEKNTQKTTQVQMQYEFDKKEAATKEKEAKKDAETKRIKNQQLFIIIALGIIVLAVVIIALIQFRNSRHKQKANNLLKNEKEKVEETLLKLKSTQAQLIQSEKMASLGELTAGIAHEIQNPLNFVNNFSDLNTELVDELKEELKTGNIEEANFIADDIKTNNQKISHHGKRAESIVTGMLQHSRTSTGQKEPTDINKLADEYLRLAYHGIRAKDKGFNCDIVTEFDETIGKVNIIPQEIGRVILNLVNNAFYAVNERLRHPALAGQPDNRSSELVEEYKPTVTVTTKKENSRILISIADNGNGIPDKIKDKIFNPFFTTKPTGQGTGLGLSLSYDIVKAHGGDIKVESKVNEGSIFIVEIRLI